MEFVETRQGNAFWRFRCDCGNETIVAAFKVKRGSTSSCGCQRFSGLGRKTHGKSGTPLHKAWKRMRDRCYGRPDRRPHYAGRGIRAVPEWDDFRNFESWALMNGYAEGLELDRIDVNGNYGPENCRWLTRSENMRNTRVNQTYLYRGRACSIFDLIEASGGLERRTILARLKRGWSVENAVETPLDPRGSVTPG